MRESLEARQRDANNPNADYDDEKMLVQMNILKTIDQLTSSLDGTDLIDKVESIIAPALQVTLANNLVGEFRLGWGRCSLGSGVLTPRPRSRTLRRGV